MLLSGVLFILILAGCWVYCLIDAALTPSTVFRGLPKAAWIGVIAMTFALGGIAWLCYRATLRSGTRPATGPVSGPRILHPHTYASRRLDWEAEQASFARHPAGRLRNTPSEGWASPKGPDDDPDFLRELDRRIRRALGDEPE